MNRRAGLHAFLGEYGAVLSDLYDKVTYEYAPLGMLQHGSYSQFVDAVCAGVHVSRAAARGGDDVDDDPENFRAH